MQDHEALAALAAEMGVHTHCMDGMGRPVAVSAETLVRVCAALGARLEGPEDAHAALEAFRARRAGRLVPPVLVAWDGVLHAPAGTGETRPEHAAIRLESGEPGPALPWGPDHPPSHIPLGYHTLEVRDGDRTELCTIVSAPTRSWKRPGDPPKGWGVATQLAALRSARSRSVGDLRDLEALCDWVRDRGGDLVTVLPILPTFNEHPVEPSPYSPVSRLFWSELVLDLHEAHEARPAPEQLDVRTADHEVRNALRGATPPHPEDTDPELDAYARFRGAQARLGRNWRDWPTDAREGRLTAEHVDPEEARFHRTAQARVREQLSALRRRLAEKGVRLGLDLAVGVHPDGYDTWSRPELFVEGVSVGAPPDGGFPSGQDWGFRPVHPERSREEGHEYLRKSIRHQAELAGVLRIDHIMAWSRLYWIPHGMGLHEGTYVSYPAEELFAILTLESHRCECEITGENLGTVPPEIGEALHRHGIDGMYLAQFAAYDERMPAPGPGSVAMVGTHDTPTFAGWLAGNDIAERIRCGLLAPDAEAGERAGREWATRRLAEHLGGSVSEPGDLLTRLLGWLGASAAPLVVLWLEDLWLESQPVNVPGTSSATRPNWQRPMLRLLDSIVSDPEIVARVEALDSARSEP